ncbi:Steroid 17-alpha-hydroxylase/17,20 lyase [Holothuria leucospilota]|uniref:Steroid 17-alpha-hydroxylase/17,20 lyase n=1 Tax=Holothuria leucospilota TaxID=206669 RepID=A0A9Q1CQN9_HOLLE|nr:Steroid 17-alpha-hydroxylase/17,20 lyase [Holothuria leucospilota]
MLGLSDTGAIFENATSLTIASIAVALFTMLVWSQQKPRKDFPPGPRGWPVVGNLLEFRSEKALHIIFMEYAKKYGDIFSIRAGQRWTVVLNGAGVIKEALLKKGVEFADRPKCLSIDVFSGGSQDLMFGQFSPTWKLQRKLAFSAFRNLASGNNERFAELVYSTIPGLTKYLESKGSKPFNPRPAMATTIINIVSTICFGKRYEFDDPDLQRWLKYNHDIFDVLGSGITADYIPILRYIPTRGVKRLKEIVDELLSALRKEVEEHRARYDGGEPRDLIEMLFQARQQMEDEGSENMKMITEKRITLTVASVFDDNDTDAEDNDVDDYGDYDEESEDDDYDNGDDDKNDDDDDHDDDDNDYDDETKDGDDDNDNGDDDGGYTLPKGTWVLVNLYSMHHDENLWDEPYQFKPEHFLDETGELRLHQEGFMPFSTGRRVCVGETVAKAELFLLFSWLFHHFRFAKAPGMEETDYTKSVSFVYEFDDPDLQRWLKYNQEVFDVLGNGITADYIPILRHIPTPGVKRVKGLVDEFLSALRKEVEEHRATYDGGEPKDLIEMLFKARQEMEDEGSENMKMITEERIILTVASVFDAFGYVQLILKSAKMLH